VSWPVLDNTSVLLFMLILARTAAFFSVFPALGGPAVPMRIKAAAAGVLSILLYGAVPAPAVLPTATMAQLLLILRETLLGLMLGSLVHFVFMSAQFAGQAIGVQMGLAAASLFDPSTRETVSVSGRLYYLLALLLFLTLNLHHHFLAGLGRSFTVLPLGETGLAGSGFIRWAELSGQVLFLALRLSMPVLASLLLLDLALGFLGRLVPQMNIFLVGFPLKIALGLMVLALGIKVAGPLMIRAFESLLLDFHSLMSWMR
jgi:flagellar biosynthesis protein FliR